MTDVIVVGGGPTGLMLACELRLARVRVVVLDRLPGRTGESRAGGLHPRSMELLDQRGLVDRFIAAGRPLQVGHFSALRLDFEALETRYPYVFNLLQVHVERLLEARAAELGVQVRWSSGVVDVRQDEAGVEVVLFDGRRLRASHVVGCDGGRSTVRKLAGIDFPGTPATMTALLGDVVLADPPSGPIFQPRREHGDFSVLQFEPGWHRVMTCQYDRVADRDSPATFEGLREALLRIAGTDFGMHGPRWLSRFSDAARQAERYRHGRVLLAGDAAHIHFPSGGQGMNVGIQDAVNLGWKLGAVIRGEAPDSLLDTYHAERHPVGARLLKNTRAQTALARPGPHTEALREQLAGLIALGEVNRALAGMISGLDVRYALGDEHPLLGMRVPDLALDTSAGASRLFELMHAARPLLLDLTGEAGLAAIAEDWADRIDVVTARCRDAAWSVPALLIRPDGHVAWVAAAGAPALRAALTTWCGPADASV
jgi:3-(3-hydroxy-phenyl)propionate hydroxylase